MELEYRFADIDELDFLVRMRIRDLRMFSECAAGTKLEDAIRRFYEIKMKENACRTLLAYAGRELAATATLYFYDVLPSNENRMVERLMEEARGEAKMVCLNSSEQALGMYERMGFSSKKGYLVYYLN